MQEDNWKSLLPEMRENSDDIPWRTRREAVQQAAAVLRSGREDLEAEEILRIGAQDPKWEIRKAVAEVMPTVSDALFFNLAKILADDSNHFVVEAVEQAGRSRSAIQTTQNSLHRGLRARLFDIEGKFGNGAALAAMRFADRFTSEHLKAVSHNLKTMLTSLKSASRDTATGSGDAAFQKATRQILLDVEHLERLAKDIGKYSDLLDLSPTMESPRALIEEAYRLASGAVTGQGRNSDAVSFSVESSSTDLIPVSKTHMVVVFSNLIQNAIEAHALSEALFKPGKVTVSISNSGKMLKIAIADTGCGLNPQDLTDLLEFIPGRTSKSWGTGYGLSIARKYVEAHGGTFAMTSTESEGTTITIELPMEKGE